MNLLEEYSAVRQGAGVIDRGARGRIVVRGADRKTFLHALLTNDIVPLDPGTGCYAALLTPQGRMIADMQVFAMVEVMLLDVAREVKDLLLERFDQLIFSEDVQLGDVSDTWGCVGVYGPLAADVAGRALAGDFSQYGPFQNRRTEFQGELVVVARSDGFGLPGILLFTAAELIPALTETLLASGAVPLSTDVAEVLRVEAGDPAFLVDMTDDTIPLEAGIETRAISYLKGCYPGQEVIIRIRDRGHGKIARKLVGLTIAGNDVPAAGSRMVDGDKDVGHVTSAVFSPSLAMPVALGYVHRDFANPGSTVTIVDGDRLVPGTVTELPFVR
jgi:folate-binding protein YgfZ